MKKAYFIAAILIICIIVFALCSCRRSTNSPAPDATASTPTGTSTGNTASVTSGTSGTSTANTANTQYSGEGVGFESIVISQNFCTAEDHVYELTRTDSGVHIANYTKREFYSSKTNHFETDINMIRELDAGMDVYNDLVQLAATYDIASWDGFSGNNPDVLDGSSFNMSAVLADGSEIEASGTNKFPSGFRDFVSAIKDYAEAQDLDSADFTTQVYSMKLP